MLPVFSLSLNQKVLAGRVAIGEFDGRRACIAAATNAEKVFVHNPSARSLLSSSGRKQAESAASSELIMLDIRQRVTALAAGALNPKLDRDYLLVGTPTNLLAYDVENNADLFHKDVADGVGSIAVGTIGSMEMPLAIAGGNCSLQGFDFEGNDPFWTVTGDNVTAISIMDYNGDGKTRQLLLVGSEDFAIRVFAHDEIVSEITETESVTGLVPVQDCRFGYALSNGTVGVYERTTRWWRIKSKNSATSVSGFDLDGDGVNELVTGWSNGKLDARNDRTGEVIFKDTFSHAVSGLVIGDYSQSGRMQLIACSSEGEIRGYQPPPSSTSGEARRALVLDAAAELDSLRELAQRKNALLLELANYEENQRAAASASSQGGHARTAAGKELGMIPAQTQLSTALAINLGTDGRPPHVEVSLSTSNETVIRCVLIFAEGIFDGECHVLHPKEPASSLHVPIYPPRDIPVDLHIKAFVGYSGGSHFHVFELTRQLPRFSMYCRQSEASTRPRSSTGVHFRVNERPARIALWLQQNFLVGDESVESGNAVDTSFSVLRSSSGGDELRVCVSADGRVSILCDRMDLCGDLVQSLSEYLALDDLASTCDFPEELATLEQLMRAAEDLQHVRQRLAAEMADHSGMIRTLVVRAEDARLMTDMRSMRKWYGQLFDINRDLIASHKIRCSNHEQLMETLKQVNLIIQKAGRLRAGKSKAKVISDCRNAIKESNVPLITKIIRTGEGA